MTPNREGRKASAARAVPRMKGAGAVMLKAAGWILAVPALCAAVLVAGAVPLYLLLPDKAPEPRAAAPVETASRQAGKAPATPPVEKPAIQASLPPEPESVVPDASEPAEARDAAPASEDAGEDIALAPAEPAHLGVRPTPRPEQLAVREPVPSETPSPALRSPKTAGTDRVSRAVTLRAGPHGRQLGVLPQGTDVAVIRCDGWCEIRSAEGDGWIHSSFLAAQGRTADDAAPRVAERSQPRADESRREARREERHYREDGRHGDPDWMLPDDPLAYADDEDPRVLFYDDLEPYR